MRAERIFTRVPRFTEMVVSFTPREYDLLRTIMWSVLSGFDLHTITCQKELRDLAEAVRSVCGDKSVI